MKKFLLTFILAVFSVAPTNWNETNTVAQEAGGEGGSESGGGETSGDGQDMHRGGDGGDRNDSAEQEARAEQSARGNWESNFDYARDSKITLSCAMDIGESREDADKRCAADNLTAEFGNGGGGVASGEGFEGFEGSFTALGRSEGGRGSKGFGKSKDDRDIGEGFEIRELDGSLSDRVKNAELGVGYVSGLSLKIGRIEVPDFKLASSITPSKAINTAARTGVGGSGKDVPEVADLPEGLQAYAFSNALGGADSWGTIGAGVAIGMTPGLNDVVDAFEFSSGYNAITLEKLSTFERVLSGVGLLIGSGQLFRAGLKSVNKTTNALMKKISRVESLSRVSRFNPLKPGPLHQRRISGSRFRVSDTFRSGSYLGYETTKTTKLYRSIGPDGRPNGRFWTREKPLSGTQAQIDSALETSWGNQATKVVEIDLPKGTKIYEGIAARIQNFKASDRNISNHIGGGNQVYLDRVDINDNTLLELISKGAIEELVE